MASLRRVETLSKMLILETPAMYHTSRQNASVERNFLVTEKIYDAKKAHRVFDELKTNELQDFISC